MKTYLLQRASFKNGKDKSGKGIDTIISLDYMGSSEFEWGALPNSLKNIRKDINDYTYLDVLVSDKLITVFCKVSQKSDVELYLINLAKNNMILKEFSAFDSYINNDGYFKDRFDFWWDIDNDLMFWKKNQEFELKFKTIITTKPS
jgi:hypothetical protein